MSESEAESQRAVTSTGVGNGFIGGIREGARGADLLFAIFSLTILLGALLLAGNQLLAAGDGLGLMDFARGGKIDANKSYVSACDFLPDSKEESASISDKTTIIKCRWTQGDQIPRVLLLVLLDSIWGILYAVFLVLLFRRLISELIVDRQLPGSVARSSGPSFFTSGGSWVAMLMLALPVLLLLTDWFENWQIWHVATLDWKGPGDVPAGWLHRASSVKEWLITANLVAGGMLLALWYFGLVFRASGADDRNEARARLRVAVGRIVWRTRYVLVLLAVFAGLCQMDQSRDVMIGLAQGLSRGDAYWWIALIAIIVSALGVWLFAYACWLWARIAARSRTPDTDTLKEDIDRKLEPNREHVRDPDGRDHFAKWWARGLGLIPLLLLIGLAGKASGDATLAESVVQGAGGMSTAFKLYLFAWVTAAVALAIQWQFIVDRGREKGGAGRDDKRKRSLYFNTVPLDRENVGEELAGDSYAFPFTRLPATFLLPIVALFFFVAIRGFDLFRDDQVPVVLATSTFALTFWTCVIGLLGHAAQRQGIPWVLGLLILAGVFGALGWTDNHRVLTTPYPMVADYLLVFIWLVQLVLALFFAAALYWAWARISAMREGESEPAWIQTVVDKVRMVLSWLFSLFGLRSQDQGSTEADQGIGPQNVAVDVGVFVLIALLAIGLLQISNIALGPGSADLDPGKLAGREYQRPPLEDRIGSWIQDLLEDEDKGSVAGGVQDDEGSPIPVYFVTAEGGGIRSGYWTALVLSRLNAEEDLRFKKRTFSISGVSGGSIGGAVWSVCENWTSREPGPHGEDSAAGDPSAGCDIHALAKADLLTPLLSAWLFEDVLGAIVPTSGCDTPGCGALSRGLLFERALEKAVPRLTRPLMEANTKAPFLFMNSTRVESGGRAIASVVPIDTSVFYSSVDQLADLGDRMPISTAAHNSARFPYTNAIGSGVERDGDKVRYHLADGGIFDNSGGGTSVDIMRTFARCLFSEPLEAPKCGMEGEVRESARMRLVPVAIKIRNNIEPTFGAQPEAPSACAPLPQAEPESLSWYPDVLGPVVGALNAIGTGANGLVAEQDICRVVQAWRILRRQTPNTTKSTLPLVARFDLPVSNTLFPLGWYLSPTAAYGMCKEANELGDGEYHLGIAPKKPSGIGCPGADTSSNQPGEHGRA